MSLILDALNKSRSDNGEVPGLGAEHYREEPPTPWLRYLPWAGLALAILLIIFLLVGEDEPAQDNIVSPVAELSRNLGSAATSVTEELKARADEGRAKRADQAPAAQAPTPRATPPTAPQVSVPQVPAGATRAAATPASPPAGKPAAASSTGAGVDADAIKALYEKRQRAGEALRERAAAARATAAASTKPEPVSQPEEESIDVEEVLRNAQEDVANASLVDHPAPFLVSLSQQTKNDIPTILYQRHDYDTQGRSSVTLNGKSLRVGGTPATGLRVDEILEDSVILDYRGTQFRLRALNSWVNL